MYTRASLYSSLRSLFSERALEAAIRYVNGQGPGISSYSAVMQSPLAFIFLVEYAPAEVVFERFSDDAYFRCYIRCLMDLSLRSFERDCFPLNHQWADFFDEKDQNVYYKMDCLSRYGLLRGDESDTVITQEKINTTIDKINEFYNHSALFRQMIFEALFGVRPTLVDMSFEWAATKMQILLKDCGYAFYEVRERQGFISLMVRYDI